MEDLDEVRFEAMEDRVEELKKQVAMLMRKLNYVEAMACSHWEMNGTLKEGSKYPMGSPFNYI